MCWNKDVSLNTFLFSSSVLLLIMYNNKYTKYKIKEFDKYSYLFFISFILMQLIEYFLWINIKNKFYNNLFTISAFILLFFQPIASMFLITNIDIRNLLLGIYFTMFIPYYLYLLYNYNIHSSVSKNGNMIWEFYTNNIAKFVWFMFFFSGLVLNKKYWWGGLFGMITSIIMFLMYYRDNTVGSMWCWVVNSIMIFYATYILFYLPFIVR